MVETTIASLAMQIDARSADPAASKLENLIQLSEQLEARFGAAGRAVGSSIASQGAATGQAERSFKSLIRVYGEADEATDRFAMSQEATATLMLRNATAQAALAKEVEQLDRRIQRLTSAHDPLAGEILKTNSLLKEADDLYEKGAISAQQYAAATDGLKDKINNLEAAHGNGLKSTKALQQATLNLGRQFTDIGVQLAGGQNPFLVLTQQLPQIADGFQVAKMQGLSFKGVIAGMAAELAPFLPLLIGVGTVVGTVFGGAALAARALNEDNKHLVDSLGLTEKQLKHLKDKGVDTGITIGDVFKGTFNYIKGAVAPTLTPVIKWFNDLFDSITKGAVITVKAIVGGFAGAFAGIKTIWADLPAVMGDLFASGANLAISAIEKLLNFATAGINALIEKANSVSAKVNGPQIGSLGQFSLGRVDNPNAGAASRTASNAAAAVADAYAKVGAGVDKVFAGIGAEIIKAAKDRVTKAAGDPEKARKTAEIRDMSEERSAQIAAMVEQATAEELRSRLALVQEIKERADIERQIATAAVAAQQARVDAQIAALQDEKGISPLTKAALTLELQRVKFIQGMTADNQREAINRRAAADLAAESLSAAQSGRQNEIDLLDSRGALTYSIREQLDIENKIRALRHEMAVADQQAIIDRVKEGIGTAKQAEMAEARIKVLDEIYENDKKIAARQHDLLKAYASAVEAFSDMARSVIDGDVGGSISGLSNSLTKVSGLFSDPSKGLGKLLGQAGDFLGPVGAAVSAVTGVLGAIGQKSAEAAQRKLDALNKSVEDLRADNRTSSGSIAGALEEANRAWNADLEYSSQMVSSLRSIDGQIGSLASALGRSITAGNLLSTAGLGLGTTASKGTALFGLANLFLGGSKTKTELLDQGLNFNASTYGDIMANGVTGSTYADLVTTKTKKFLGVTTGVKVSNSTVTGAIDGDLLSQISGVIEALGQGVLSAAAVFGEQAAKSAEAALGSAVVDLGKLSLKDLSASEIADVLQATFDKVGDQLAAAGVPGLDKLATVGEGAFETLTRLAREYEVVDVSLASIGKTFGAVGLASIEARDNLVQLLGGVDEFTSKTSFFATNFLTEAEQLAPVQAAVTKELTRLGLASDLTRDQFKSLVLGLDVSTESGAAMYAALLSLAPAFDKVAAAAEAAATMSSEITEYYAREAGAARHAERMQAEEAARQEEIRGQGLLRAEIYATERVAAEETAKAWEELVGKVNEGRQALLRAGDLVGALAGENSVRQGIGFGGANFDAGGFNIAYAAQQSRIAQELLARVSSDALNTENVSKVIGDLSRVIQPDVLRQSFESGVRAGLLDGIGAGAGADRIADALSGVISALAAKDLNSSYSTDMGGFSSVLAARAAVDRAGQYGSFGARSFMGGDITAYQEALLKLDRELDRGGITLEDYARATTNLRNAMGSTMDIVDSFTAQQGRLEAALVDLGRAGLSSIDYYFGEITKSADALAIAAAKAEDPISAVTQAIGRLTSIGDVFGQSALAAFDGGFATDAVSKSALIAQSAAIAAQVVTSADAARVAKQIATDAAFAATDAAGIRDASLLLDGVKAFDPKGFEDAFLRLNNALVKGDITEDQYSTLFANALATYQGLDDQVSATSGVFADLRKTAKALADQLAITEAANPSMGLAEAQRQYDAILARAVGGDANAVSGLNAAVSALVDAGKAGFGTSDEQAGLVARVVSDLRQAELAQPINPHVEANAPLLVELQALRKEVAAFRAENRATGEKTALNTSDMRRIAEDTQVNGQLVVTQ